MGPAPQAHSPPGSPGEPRLRPPQQEPETRRATGPGTEHARERQEALPRVPSSGRPPASARTLIPAPATSSPSPVGGWQVRIRARAVGREGSGRPRRQPRGPSAPAPLPLEAPTWGGSAEGSPPRRPSRQRARPRSPPPGRPPGRAWGAAWGLRAVPGACGGSQPRSARASWARTAPRACSPGPGPSEPYAPVLSFLFCRKTCGTLSVGRVNATLCESTAVAV